MKRRDGRMKEWFTKSRGLARVQMVVATGLLSAAIVGAGFYALYSTAETSNENEWRTTVEQLQLLHEMVRDYREACGSLPPNLEAVTGGKTPVDPWGNPYVYRQRGDVAFAVYSLGIDGEEGTIEDVHLNDAAGGY